MSDIGQLIDAAESTYFAIAATDKSPQAGVLKDVLVDLYLHRDKQIPVDADLTARVEAAIAPLKSAASTRTFHTKAQSQLARALQGCDAVEGAAEFFSADQFVADQQGNPLLKVGDAYLPISSAAVAKVLPASLRRTGKAQSFDEISDIEDQVAEQRKIVENAASRAREYRGGTNVMVRFSNENRKLQALEKQLKKLKAERRAAHAPPKRAPTAGQLGQIESARQRCDRTRRAAVENPNTSTQLAASRANQDLARLKRELGC